MRPGGVPAFFAVGDSITFTGHAVASVGGNLPVSDLTWNVRIYHCPSNCHTHDIETLTGTASGGFGAPDHSYPSLLWIQLTAIDSFGLSDSASVYLYPKTSTFTITSSPAGVTITAGTFTGHDALQRHVLPGRCRRSLGARPAHDRRHPVRLRLVVRRPRRRPTP